MAWTRSSNGQHYNYQSYTKLFYTNFPLKQEQEAWRRQLRERGRRNTAKEVRARKRDHTQKVSTQTFSLGDPGVQGPGLYFSSSSSFALTACSYATAAPTGLYQTPIFRVAGLGTHEDKMACPKYMSTCIYLIVTDVRATSKRLTEGRKKFTLTFTISLSKISLRKNTYHYQLMSV